MLGAVQFDPAGVGGATVSAGGKVLGVGVNPGPLYCGNICAGGVYMGVGNGAEFCAV